MLFTRCPGCQTTFRITADTLRVANGAVRCGSCATVFSAFSGLQQNALEDDLQADDEFLSPTMQMQELAGIEELPGPEVDEVPPAEGEGEGEGELDDAATGPPRQPLEAALAVVDAPLETQDGDADIPIVATQAQVEDAPAQDSGDLDNPVELVDLPATEPVTPERQRERADLAASSESSNELQFDMPTDDWAQLIGEIEQSAETRADAEDEAGSAERHSGEDESEPDAVELWDVGDPAASESWNEIEIPAAEEAGYERVAVGELESAVEIDASVSDSQIEAEVSELLDAQPDISPEQVDATLSADPDPGIVEALEAGLRDQSVGDKHARLWTVGSAAMACALLFQFVHHFRGPLAGQNLVGPLVHQPVLGLRRADAVVEHLLVDVQVLKCLARFGFVEATVIETLAVLGPRRAAEFDPLEFVVQQLSCRFIPCPSRQTYHGCPCTVLPQEETQRPRIFPSLWVFATRSKSECIQSFRHDDTFGRWWLRQYKIPLEHALVRP